jgi:hypothetical protein
MNKMRWEIRSSNRSNFSCASIMEMDCTKDHLWYFLSQPGHLKNITAAYKDHYSDQWTGVGSQDTIVYKNGATRQRSVSKWISRKLIAMQVTDPTSNNPSSVAWEILDGKQPDCCCLSITISTNAYQTIPRPIWPMYWRCKLSSRYQKYLKPLLNAVYYSTQVRNGEDLKTTAPGQ